MTVGILTVTYSMGSIPAYISADNKQDRDTCSVLFPHFYVVSYEACATLKTKVTNTKRAVIQY